MAKTVHCEVVTDSSPEIGISFFQLACGAPAIKLYESTFSQTPVAATFQLFANDSPCTMTVIVTEGDGDQLPPFVITPTTDNRIISLTIRSLRSITVQCTGGETGDTCSGFFDLQLHYCKCCQV